MKKSEMEKLLLNGLCDLGQWYERSPESVASALCILLQPKEGWEPEEPALPKEVRWGQPWHAGHGGLPPIVDEATQKPLEGKLWHRWLEAALAAYNRIQQAGGEDKTFVVNKQIYDQLCNRAANVQRCADRSDRLVDRWKGVVERALVEARKPYPSFKRILAILEERELDQARPMAVPFADREKEKPDAPRFSWEKWETILGPRTPAFAEDEEWMFNRVLGAVEVLSDTKVKGSERIANALAILTGRDS